MKWSWQSKKFAVALLLATYAFVLCLCGDMSDKYTAWVFGGIGVGYGFFNKWCDHA